MNRCHCGSLSIDCVTMWGKWPLMTVAQRGTVATAKMVLFIKQLSFTTLGEREVKIISKISHIVLNCNIFSYPDCHFKLTINREHILNITHLDSDLGRGNHFQIKWCHVTNDTLECTNAMFCLKVTCNWFSFHAFLCNGDVSFCKMNLSPYLVTHTSSM